jgi:hypothetical protein
MNQEEQTASNRTAWSHAAYYEVWCKVYGAPQQVAAELRRDPSAALKRYLPHTGDVRGKRILNPLVRIPMKSATDSAIKADTCSGIRPDSLSERSDAVVHGLRKCPE